MKFLLVALPFYVTGIILVVNDVLTPAECLAIGLAFTVAAVVFR